MSIVGTLLTPLMLSVAPATITVPAPHYSHATQGSIVVAQSTSMMTINGTQTFGIDGRPYDSDSDSSRD